MNRAILLVFAAAVFAVAGCDDSISEATRVIEFHQVGEPLFCSSNKTVCTGSGCKSCTINKDCPDGQSCIGAFNTKTTGTYRLNFGKKTIKNEWSMAVRISDLSSLSASITEVAFDGDPGPFAVKDVPQTVPAKGEAQFTVTYSPTTDRSVDTATLIVKSKSTSIPTATIELYGEGTTSEASLFVETPEGLDTINCENCDSGSMIATIDMGAAPVGAWKEMKATIVNVGPAPMNVKIYKKDPLNVDFEIVSPQPDKDGFTKMTVQPCTQVERGACPQPTTSCPEGQELTVAFNPGSGGNKSLVLVVEANDSSCKAENMITLIGRAVSSAIQVCTESAGCPVENPMCACTDEGKPTTTLMFGDVKSGQKVVKKIVVTNVGDKDATLKKVALRNASAVYDLDKSVPPDVTIGASGSESNTFEVSVSFSPTSEVNEVNNVDVDVETPKGGVETYSVELKGSSQPQFCITPDGEMKFVVAAGGNETQTAVVTNCGYATLNITKIEVDKTSGNWQEFSIVNPPSKYPVGVEPGNTLSFDVKFTNNPAIENEAAQIIIGNNDPYWMEYEGIYYMSVISTDNTKDMPPTAVLFATNGDVQEIDCRTLPLKVEMDGSLSHDDKGTLTYRWEMVAVPANSVATMLDDTLPVAYFMADTVVNGKYGKYTVRLTVTDTLGQTDSAQMTVVIQCL